MSSLDPSKNGLRREDFALEAVPLDQRAPAMPGLFAVVLGIPTALVFFAVGGALLQAYGTIALLTALAVASVIIGTAGCILTSYACRTGLDSDLMSIRAGFGLRGSAITSAIYSANFVVLFAIEASIMAGAMHSHAPEVPRSAVLVALAATTLYFAWRGVRRMAWVMAATLPLFLGLLLLAVVNAIHEAAPSQPFLSVAPTVHGSAAVAWLSALATLLVFIVNATVAADIGRFLRPERRRTGANLFGVGLQVVSFAGATLLGAWFSWRLRGSTDPGVYLPALIGAWGVACVVVSQVRINMINAYSGSLSLSNFGARAAGVTPGRHVWMTMLVVISTVLAMTSISDHLLTVLTFEAVFVMGWASTLIACIVYVEPTQARQPDDLREYPDINPIGTGALVITLALAVPLAFGVGGDLGTALAPLVAMITGPVAVIACTRLARARGWAPTVI